MIKNYLKILSILLINIVIFGIGITNAVSLYMDIYKNGISSTNISDSSYEINVFEKGNLITTKGGYGKGLLWYKSGRYMFWQENGIPYIRGYNSTYYGNAGKYAICDGQLPICDNYPCQKTVNVCTESTLTNESISIYSNFLSTVTNNDYYAMGGYSSTLYFCFSSQQLNQFLCFASKVGTNSDTNYGNNFDNINSNLLKNSPAYSQGDSGNGGGFDINTSNTYVSSCSKQRAINWYEANGFSSKLCYGGLNNFDIRDGQPIGTLPVYGTGLDIEEIWFNTAGYRQGGTTGDGLGYSSWFGYWRQLFETYKRGGYSVNPFINTPLVLFTYFGAVDTYGGTVADSKDILEYCELKLYTSDLSLDYTGVNKSFVCSTALDILSGSLHNVVDGSGNILKGYNIVGERRLGNNGSGNSQGSGGVGAGTTGDNYSGNNIVVSDGKSFISEIFGKLDNMDFNNLDKSDFGLGVLPTYIILFFLAIVVFRFISH